MKDERAKIGDALKRAIKQRGYTQEEFAEKVGIGFSSLKNYLNGTKVYNYELLMRFADVLECSYDYLLGKSNSPIREHTDVSNATGLSDGAIEKLGRYASMDRDSLHRQEFYNGLNAIICSDALVNGISLFLLWDKKLEKETNDFVENVLPYNEDIEIKGFDEIPLQMDVIFLINVINRLNDTKNLIDKEYLKNTHLGITKAIEGLKAVRSGSQDEK